MPEDKPVEKKGNMSLFIVIGAALVAGIIVVVVAFLVLGGNSETPQEPVSEPADTIVSDTVSVPEDLTKPYVKTSLGTLMERAELAINSIQDIKSAIRDSEDKLRKCRDLADSLSIKYSNLKIELEDIVVAKGEGVDFLLEDKAEYIKSKEDSLNMLMDSIETLRKEVIKEKANIEKMYSELLGLKGMIKEREKQKDVEEEKVYSNLAQVYGNMKPAKAAEILSNLDNPVIVQILLRMPPRKMAKVLSAMDPARSAILTREIKNRVPDDSPLLKQMDKLLKGILPDSTQIGGENG